ncbi:MAG: CPBP family intramembrane glutamic endopeptidase [Bacteroidota bacterium]
MVRDLHPWLKVIILVGYLAGLGLLTIMGSDAELNMAFTPGYILVLKILQVIGVVLLFIMPSLLFSYLFTAHKLKYPQFHVPPRLSQFILGAIAFLAALPFIAWMDELNKSMTLPEALAGVEGWMRKSEESLKQVTEAFLADTSAGGMILNLFVIAFMAAVSEELFFRGVLQKAFTEATRNIHIAVWVSAILFSAFHMQFFGFFPRMIMGVALGYLFAWSGSLWVPVFAHFVNNGTAVVLSWMVNNKMIAEDPSVLADGESGFLPGMASLAVTIALMLLVYKLRPQPADIDVGTKL